MPNRDVDLLDKLQKLSDCDRKALFDFMCLPEGERERRGHLKTQLLASILLHRKRQRESVN